MQTIYYDSENEIMFKEEKEVTEAPLIGDWIRWHYQNWIVENRCFDFDSNEFKIYCKKV